MIVFDYSRKNYFKILYKDFFDIAIPEKSSYAMNKDYGMLYFKYNITMLFYILVMISKKKLFQ